MYSNEYNESQNQWMNNDIPGSLRVENDTSGFLEQDLKSMGHRRSIAPKGGRESARLQRARLSSIDGDTAEEHDQFYRDHKLLLVLFRVLAVMPITRSSPGENLPVHFLNIFCIADHSFFIK